MKKFLEKYSILEPMVRPFLSTSCEVVQPTQSQPPVNFLQNTGAHKNSTNASVESETFSKVNPNLIAEGSKVSEVNIQENMSYKYSDATTANQPEFYKNTIKNSKIIVISTPTADANSKESLRNLLRSKHTVESLPPSEVKPSYMDDASFQRSCGVKAFVDLVKDGGEVTDSLLAFGYSQGFAGHNLDKIQSAVPHVPVFQGKHDLHKNFSENLRAALPAKEQEYIAKMSLKEPLQIAEYAALGVINPSQDVKIVHSIGENPNPRTLAGYFNLTPNKKPDFVSYLPQPVGSTTAVGFDFKYILGRIADKNIVKGCTINLEKHIVESHDLLLKSLKEHLTSGNLNAKNQALALEFREHLVNNLAVFKQNKDIDGAIYSYNSLRNEFGTFLIENKIGMTLLAHLDKSDFVINSSIEQAFVDKFLDNYTNLDSHLRKILDAHAAANFGKIPNENHCVTAIAKFVFPDK